jgi:hypothetical protein
VDRINPGNYGQELEQHCPLYVAGSVSASDSAVKAGEKCLQWFAGLGNLAHCRLMIPKGILKPKLRNEQLQSDPGLLAELSCRSLLQIQLKSGVPSSDSRLPRRVWLLVAPRLDAKAAQPAVLKDVFLLTVVREGDSTRASIAVRPDQLRQLGALIGSADVFVVYSPS